MKYFKDKNNQIYALDEKDISNFKKPEVVYKNYTPLKWFELR